jgi:hypothetical protein
VLWTIRFQLDLLAGGNFELVERLLKIVNADARLRSQTAQKSSRLRSHP